MNSTKYIKALQDDQNFKNYSEMFKNVIGQNTSWNVAIDRISNSTKQQQQLVNARRYIVNKIKHLCIETDESDKQEKNNGNTINQKFPFKCITPGSNTLKSNVDLSYSPVENSSNNKNSRVATYIDFQKVVTQILKEFTGKDCKEAKQTLNLNLYYLVYPSDLCAKYPDEQREFAMFLLKDHTLMNDLDVAQNFWKALILGKRNFQNLFCAPNATSCKLVTRGISIFENQRYTSINSPRSPISAKSQLSGISSRNSSQTSLSSSVSSVQSSQPSCDLAVQIKIQSGQESLFHSLLIEIEKESDLSETINLISILKCTEIEAYCTQVSYLLWMYVNYLDDTNVNADWIYMRNAIYNKYSLRALHDCVIEQLCFAYKALESENVLSTFKYLARAYHTLDDPVQNNGNHSINNPVSEILLQGEERNGFKNFISNFLVIKKTKTFSDYQKLSQTKFQTYFSEPNKPSMLNKIINVIKQLYEFDYSQSGGKQTHKYKGKNYIVRTGSRGGKYILCKKEKIYLSKI